MRKGHKSLADDDATTKITSDGIINARIKDTGGASRYGRDEGEKGWNASSARISERAHARGVADPDHRGFSMVAGRRWQVVVGPWTQKISSYVACDVLGLTQ